MAKILTLDDLYNYYESTGKSAHFDAHDEGCDIHVQVPYELNFEKDDKDDGLTPVKL